MPALEALLPRLDAAHTLAAGVSVDTTFSHAAWGHALGGVSFPLLADFHPKGEVASRFGVYLHEQGICDRATVIVDADGVVRHASSVTPSGRRDVEELVAFCERLDREWETRLPDRPAPKGLPEGAELYVKDRCMFSRWALYARANLHLEDRLPVRNVSQDPSLCKVLEAAGGKNQTPALVVGDRVLYESKDIVSFLVEHAAAPLV